MLMAIFINFITIFILLALISSTIFGFIYMLMLLIAGKLLAGIIAFGIVLVFFSLFIAIVKYICEDV